jgi:signal transduction histidine kinase
MSEPTEPKSVFSSMRGRFYLALFLSYVFSLATMIVFGVNTKLSVYLALILIFIIYLVFKLLIFSYTSAMYEKLAKLQENAKQYNMSSKLLIRRDLELSRANEKLQELDEIKSNFISVVAHQLRTPLSGIKWTINMLLNGDMGELNNDQKTFLMKSYESNNRMITLVNNMLDIDRIHSGKVRYNFRHIDIVDLLDNVLFEMSPQATKKNISIEFKNKLENLPQAYIDPDAIRQVIQNLLENAIKYTISGGKIQLDIKNKTEFLEVSISDNGIGISEPESKNIFQRFFRAKNAIKTETDGTGLGLYIAQTIVERNGGEIWFESIANHGTTFYFTVPLKEESLKIENIT